MHVAPAAVRCAWDVACPLPQAIPKPPLSGFPDCLQARHKGDRSHGDGRSRLGDLVFDGAYRRISIDEAARIRLTARGDIRIAEAVRGELVLRTQSGNISVSAAIGVSAIRATTSQGDITARSL